ncbi:TPA: phage tail protein, partial [Escherichia coli]|nr:phage tail protein [Escherichia coli]
RPLNWKLEFSIIDDEITADLKDQYGYTTMGFQGIYIDSNDGMVYIGWQTLDPASVWVTVHDWVTGALVTRLHFPNNVGAPEGIHVYRVAGQRYILLPYSPSRTIRIYPIEDPRTLVDKTQITNFTESTRLGV